MSEPIEEGAMNSLAIQLADSFWSSDGAIREVKLTLGEKYSCSFLGADGTRLALCTKTYLYESLLGAVQDAIEEYRLWKIWGEYTVEAIAECACDVSGSFTIEQFVEEAKRHRLEITEQEATDLLSKEPRVVQLKAKGSWFLLPCPYERNTESKFEGAIYEREP